jgi:predicted DNA-binding transcriptional regulator YafY
LDTHRTTIKSDVEMLQQAGIGIQATRSTQNLYNFIEREFDDAELKLLIDAVESAKFISKAKSDQLVAKLTELAGMNKARELKRNLVVDGRYKADNEHICYIVDAINRAINLKKKICFQMVEYNIKKERVLHNGGEKYIFSPYSLVWDGDFYYVIGYSDKYKGLGSHRVDRIAETPEILDEPAVPAGPGFDANKYINTMFRMYDAPRREVELVVSNGLVNPIIDRFGPDVTIYACDQENFRVITEVAIGTVFYNWVFGFEGKVKIKAPADVKEDYKKRILAAAEEFVD